ncbi:MAG: hypothetical protein J6B76_07700 [Peptococcaceae bacterium]|nr:hypothetical protein [Peptococcaceae bacterium]
MLKEKDTRFYVVLAITLALMVGFQFLPPFGDITPDGMKVFGVFLGAIFAWIMGEIIWSAVLAFVMLSIYGFGGIAPNLSSFVGGQITGMMVTGMLVGYALKKCGIISEIAMKITTSSWARKGPWVLALAFFVTTALLSIFTMQALPIIIIMWALFYEICEKTGIKPHNPYASYVIVGIAVLANCGMIVMPYAAMTILCMGIEQGYYPALNYNLFSHVAINFVLVTLYIIGFTLVGKLLIGSKVNISLDSTEPYKMQLTKQMKCMIFYVVLLVLLMLVPPLLPAGNPFGKLFGTTLGALGVLVILTLLMALTRIDGQPLLDLNDGFKNGVEWPLFFLVGSALLMSNYIADPKFGILSTITNLVDPLLGGHSALYILVVAVIFCVIMTNTINDIVTVTVLFPICAPFFVAAGGNVEVIAYLFTAAAVHGVFMPSGSMIGATIHGNREWLTSAEAFKYVGIQELVAIVVMAVVSIALFFLF